VFDIVEESSKFLLEIITLVSSVNKMGSDKVFIAGGIQKSKGPKTDPWGTPCFTVPHLEENFSSNLLQFFVFYLSDGIRTS
jgi:hypothetical protein